MKNTRFTASQMLVIFKQNEYGVSAPIFAVSMIGVVLYFINEVLNMEVWIHRCLSA